MLDEVKNNPFRLFTTYDPLKGRTIPDEVKPFLTSSEMPQTPQPSQGSMQFSKQTEGKINPQDVLMNPGSTFLTPGLKKMGIGGPIPAMAGFAVDVLAPGPGELGKAKDVVKVGRELLGKIPSKAPEVGALLRRFAQLTGEDKTINTIKTDKKLSNWIEEFLAKDYLKAAEERMNPRFKVTSVDKTTDNTVALIKKLYKPERDTIGRFDFKKK